MTSTCNRRRKQSTQRRAVGEGSWRIPLLSVEQIGAALLIALPGLFILGRLDEGVHTYADAHQDEQDAKEWEEDRGAHPRGKHRPDDAESDNHDTAHQAPPTSRDIPG